VGSVIFSVVDSGVTWERNYFQKSAADMVGFGANTTMIDNYFYACEWWPELLNSKGKAWHGDAVQGAGSVNGFYMSGCNFYAPYFSYDLVEGKSMTGNASVQSNNEFGNHQNVTIEYNRFVGANVAIRYNNNNGSTGNNYLFDNIVIKNNVLVWRSFNPSFRAITRDGGGNGPVGNVLCGNVWEVDPDHPTTSAGEYEQYNGKLVTGNDKPSGFNQDNS
jgi:hypothetical protein